MKTFVFLTSEFYPYGDASGICVKNIADELKKEGHRIFVLCDGVGASLVNDDINIIPVKPTLFKRIKVLCYKKNTFLYKTLYKTSFIVRRLFLGITAFMNFPNVSPLRTRLVYKTLDNLSKKEKIDYVIATFRPYDNVEALNKFKIKHKNIKSAVVYLDLLHSENPFGKIFKNYFDYLCAKSEKRTFNINDLLLIPESSKEKYTSDTYKLAKEKIQFFDFPLFLSSENIKIKKENKNKDFTIAYAGSIDGKNRCAKYFLSLINQINKRFGLNIKIEFYGNYKEAIKDDYENYDFVKFMGMIPFDRVYEVLCSADCILSISNKITFDMIPSKIFQSFSTCNKVINIVTNKNDLSLKYFNKYPCSLNIFEYEKNIEKDLESLKDFLLKEFILPDYNDVREIYIENTPQKFLEKLKNLKR